MCGRYALTLPPEALREFFKVLGEAVFPPRYNIAPTQPIHVVRPGEGGERLLDLMRWGFTPAWVKDPGKFPLLINARVETVSDKPAFRNAIRRRRCLIPATGFYEWQRLGERRKQPYLLRPARDEPIAFAGIYETWWGPDGEEVDGAAILTRSANGALADIHDRMPATVPPALFDAWLDRFDEDGQEAIARLPEAADDFFERIPISTRINAAANEDASVQTPAGLADDGDGPPAPGSPFGGAAGRGAGDRQLDLF